MIHWLHRFPRSISVHFILMVRSHNRMPPISLPLPPWRGTLQPIFIVRFVLRFLEAMQSRRRFLEVRSTPCRHRIGIHQIRTDPPIITIYINFFCCDNMTVCGLRLQVGPFQGWLLQSDPTRSSSFWRTCEYFRIVSFDTSFEVVLPCGILCNLLSSRIYDRMAGPFLCTNSGWRTNPARMRCTSCFLSYHLLQSVHMYRKQCLRFNALSMLCTVISAPRRLSRIVQCSQQL